MQINAGRLFSSQLPQLTHYQDSAQKDPTGSVSFPLWNKAGTGNMDIEMVTPISFTYVSSGKIQGFQNITYFEDFFFLAYNFHLFNLLMHISVGTALIWPRPCARTVGTEVTKYSPGLRSKKIREWSNWRLYEIQVMACCAPARSHSPLEQTERALVGGDPPGQCDQETSHHLR